jgi:hypothetical protein
MLAGVKRWRRGVFQGLLLRCDPICYYSALLKMKAHSPASDISIGPNEILREIVDAWRTRALP